MLVPALVVLFSNILLSSAWTHSCECYPASYVQSYYPSRQIVVKTQGYQPRSILVNPQPIPVNPQPIPIPHPVPVNPRPVPVYPQPVPVNPRPTPLPPINPRPSPVDHPRPYYPGPFPSDEPTPLPPIDTSLLPYPDNPPDAHPPYPNNPLSNSPQPKADPLPPSPLEPIDRSQPALDYRRMGGSALSELLSLPGAVAKSFLSGEIKV